MDNPLLSVRDLRISFQVLPAFSTRFAACPLTLDARNSVSSANPDPAKA